MKIAICNLTGKKEAWVTEATSQWITKISHWMKIEMVDLPSPKGSRDDREFKLKAEAEVLLRELTPEDLVVLCDEGGAEFTSIEFSKKLNRWLSSSKKRLVFVIGGPYGFGDLVYAKNYEKLRLSSLTFNHHLAKMVLLEQIYRGFTLLKGVQYHNA